MYSHDPAVLEDKMMELAAKLIRQLGDPDYPNISFYIEELNSIFEDYRAICLGQSVPKRRSNEPCSR